MLFRLIGCIYESLSKLKLCFHYLLIVCNLITFAAKPHEIVSSYVNVFHTSNFLSLDISLTLLESFPLVFDTTGRL